MSPKIGIREAKAQLSRLIQSVREERTEWIITDRGRPAAKLTPVTEDAPSLDEQIRKLEDRGELLPRVRPARKLPPPIPLEDGAAQRLLMEDRGQ
ncbi:MAG: type II toxin-antitoxin system Phd/YefM family antitoxin [Firmicutes bacterium]|nr:type II toxin-antitoxin system Phd/YefM family antitoxin [Bacillota bacterium]